MSANTISMKIISISPVCRVALAPRYTSPRVSIRRVSQARAESSLLPLSAD